MCVLTFGPSTSINRLCVKCFMGLDVLFSMLFAVLGGGIATGFTFTGVPLPVLNGAMGPL